MVDQLEPDACEPGPATLYKVRFHKVKLLPENMYTYTSESHSFLFALFFFFSTFFGHSQSPCSCSPPPY